ncbi:flagellar hook-length control protein FliK [Terribacillus saccharophilus]|uniref:flagellar hook-length control protein FliK n=1 Tax=Terribacillus saccharophilus TaxID=361277 RepID=UPI003982B2F3
MNNIVSSMPLHSLQASPVANDQKGTNAGKNIFQDLFQQVTSKNNDDIATAGDTVPLISDLQDKQDLQIVMQAFFDKFHSEDSVDLEKQPEDAWDLMEQVIGEDVLAAFLPTQLKNRAEEVLRNIKPSQQDSAVEDIMNQLEELQIQLSDSAALPNRNGSAAAMQPIYPKLNAAVPLTAGDRSTMLPSKNDGLPNPRKDLPTVTTPASNSGNREPLTALQTSKLIPGANTMDGQSLRGQTALQQRQTQLEPKMTEITDAIRQVVKASGNSEEKALSGNNATILQRQEPQTLDTKQVSAFQVSKQEQLVIHLKQVEQAPEQAGKDLVQKIEQAVKFSSILSDRNGLKELSMQLRPANLGELQVKLVRENGDITVQIIVSSKQAKEMLDSNIASLKHMFSPHQVNVTERVDQVQLSSSEKGSQQQFHDAADEQESRDSRQQEQQNQDGFDTAFAEILSEQEDILI